MLDILATTTEGVAVGGLGVAILGLVTIIAKRGFKGTGSISIGKDGNDNPDGNGKKRAHESDFVTRTECALMHQGLERVQNERHDAVIRAIGEVKSSITRVHERIDDIVAGK